MFALLGVFVFLTMTINVFIAVLSDVYEQEQGRTVTWFLGVHLKAVDTGNAKH